MSNILVSLFRRIKVVNNRLGRSRVKLVVYLLLFYPVNKINILLSRFLFKNLSFVKARLDDEKIFESLSVLNGPFKGLKYPSLNSYGSCLYPKLLGSYEYEIQEYIYNINRTGYDTVIDIGCAEGYYSNGFALKNRNSKVFGYDIDEDAIRFARRMAVVNGLHNVVYYNKVFDLKESSIYNSDSGRTLVFCDIEGGEVKLFTEEFAQLHKDWDYVIEVHDFVDISISDSLMKSLSKTHKLEIVYSVDDVIKIYQYSFDEIQAFSLKEKFTVLNEGRPRIMSWIVCSSMTA